MTHHVINLVLRLQYAAIYMEINLIFVRCNATFAMRNGYVVSIPQPSLGVSSLDLGRSSLERPLFFRYSAAALKGCKYAGKVSIMTAASPVR